MSDVIRALLRVQEVDGGIRDGRAELVELDRKREAAAAERASEEVKVARAKEPLEESERQHRQLESELADVEATLERLDAQFYEVTSKQAVEGIQREIGQARERKSQLEDQILERLETIDAARDTLAEAEARRDAGAEAGAAETRSWATRQGEVETELARLEGTRAELAAGVGAEALRHYDRIRRNKWPAALLTSGDVCPGCRVAIPPQKRIDIRRGQEIATCLRCGRILYAEGALAES